MTDVGGGDPRGVGVVPYRHGFIYRPFSQILILRYRVNMIQSYFSEIFARRCARRQILKQIWRNPGKGQVPKSGAEPPCCCWLLRPACRVGPLRRATQVLWRDRSDLCNYVIMFISVRYAAWRTGTAAPTAQTTTHTRVISGHLWSHADCFDDDVSVAVGASRAASSSAAHAAAMFSSAPCAAALCSHSRARTTSCDMPVPCR